MCTSGFEKCRQSENVSLSNFIHTCWSLQNRLQWKTVFQGLKLNLVYLCTRKLNLVDLYTWEQRQKIVNSQRYVGSRLKRSIFSSQYVGTNWCSFNEWHTGDSQCTHITLESMVSCEQAKSRHYLQGPVKTVKPLTRQTSEKKPLTLSSAKHHNGSFI